MVDGSIYPPTIIHQGDKADLLDKIRPEDIVEVLRNRLLGREFINNQWVEIAELKDRALTPKGAWDISNLMLSVSSRNVSVSKLNNDEIKKRTRGITRQAQKMCLKNWKEYGISGNDQLGFVNEIVLSNTLITLKQPEGEGIRKLIKETQQESKNYNLVGEEKPSRLRGMLRSK
jgi:hypothetical protein